MLQQFLLKQELPRVSSVDLAGAPIHPTRRQEVHIKEDVSLSKTVQKETEKENCHRLFKFKHSLNFASYLLGSTATLLTEYLSAMFPIFIHLY